MDLSVELRFGTSVPIGEIPEALMQGLQYRGVNTRDIVDVLHNRGTQRKCAEYIASKTGTPLVNVDMKKVRNAPDVRLALVWSLMRCGVTAKQLAEIVCSESALDRIALIMTLERKSGIVESETGPSIKIIDFVQLVGVTRHGDRKMSDSIRQAGVSISGIAQTLIDSEQITGSDEAVSRKFALIDSRSLVEAQNARGALIHEKVKTLIGEKFPKFVQDDVDASFMVASVKNNSAKMLFRKHGLAWVLIFHRPLVDESGKRRLLRLTVGAGFNIQSFEVGDEMYPQKPGAILIYSH